MTAIVRGPLQGEIIPPGRGLTLVVAPRILDPEPLLPIELGAGLSLAELSVLAAAAAGGGFRFRWVATINGLPIEAALWHLVRPKPGTTVVMRAVAEFGGDNSIIRTLLGAAVAVAGAVLTAVNPLLGAAVTVGGAMLVNMLFPVAPPVLAAVDNGSLVSPTYSLTGSGNSADQWGYIASHLGRNRYTLKLGAKTYTEFVGADQYFRMLAVIGYGPIEISDIKLGETPLASFSDVETEIREGYADDAPITLFPNDVEEEALAIDLTAAAGPQLRTTALNVDEISVDFVAPNGIVRIDANGSAQAYNVQIKVEYRLTGSGDPMALLGTQTLSGRSRDPMRVGLRLQVATAGQYDVQVTKTSTDADSDQVSEQVVWSALRGIRSIPPIQFRKPLAMIALRIRATSQLTGQIDDLNVIAASRVKAFDGAAWHDNVVSSNPADLFRHVCQGPANSKPLTDAQVDLASIEAWWAYCNANGFTFDLIRDYKGSVDDCLVMIAAAGRATVKRRDGKRGVVWDDPAAPIVQFFTPRNSWGFNWARQYQKSPPHGFRVRFINADAGDAQDERIVYDDGYNADGSDGLTKASLFEAIEVPGAKKPDLIWRHGRYHIAQARLRPETSTLNADLNSFAVSRGSRVRVMSDVALWGLASGRVLSAAAAGDNDQVVLDEPVPMEDGKTYTIRFWLSDSSSGTRDIVTVAGLATTLTLIGHGLLPARDDQWAVGEEGNDSVVLRVQRVVPGPNLSAKLYLVDDAPALANADQGAIPAFDSHITLPVDLFTAAPIDLVVTEAFEGVEGATATGALFAWSVIAGEAPIGFEAEYRDDDGAGIYSDPLSVPPQTNAIFLPGLLRGHWSFRVRCLFGAGQVSKWAELARVDITAGAGIALPDVDNFVVNYDDSNGSLKWDPVKFSKLDVRYEIRQGDGDWESSPTIGADLANPPFAARGNGTYWIKAKAQPLPGITIYSNAAASLQIEGSILVRNVVARLDERGNGWTGVITGPGAIIDSKLQTTTPNEWVYYELEAGRFFDNGYVRRIRIESSHKPVGVAADDNFLANPDVLHTADIFSAELSQLIETRIDIAEAGDLDNDVFAAGDVFASPDVFTGGTVFGDYKKFVPGEYLNRFSKLRIAMRSNAINVVGVLLDWIIVGDLADRIDHYTGLAVPGGGITVNFVPAGGVNPKPFKGGPAGAPGSDPHYQITWSQTAGDQLVITALDTVSITFKFLNGGVDVARTANLEVQGY